MISTTQQEDGRKKTFNEIWDREPNLFWDTCTHRFRNKTDYTQWSMRNWQLASGKFVPRPVGIGREFTIGTGDCSVEECIRYMRKKHGKMICMNDGEMTSEEFERAKQLILNEFEYMFPEISSYEK